jgi:hypothetical protein
LVWKRGLSARYVNVTKVASPEFPDVPFIAVSAVVVVAAAAGVMVYFKKRKQ